MGRGRFGAALGAVLTALSLPAAGGALEEKHRSVQRIEIAPRIEAKHPGLDSTLARLTETTRAGGRIVEVEAVARGARRGELEAAIHAAGGRTSGRYGRLLEARLPVRALETLAAHPAARFLRTPIRPQPQAVTGQGIAASGAAAWQSAGWAGAGVKIAVVDVGFRGWRALQPPQGDLPASVFTADFCPAGRFEGSAADNHGAAIAEVVHELAPAAELHLVCIDSVTSLGQAKDYVLSHDIPIVNHSVGWLNAGRGNGSGGPETPDGIVADARAQGVLWVNSAGNYGRTHWSGTFSDPDGNGFHNFSNLLGGDEGNDVFLLGGGCVFLKWDDWPVSDQDFDLYLYRRPNDGSPVELVAVSEDVQDGSQEPVEEVCTDFLGGDHYAAIERHAATATPRFDLFVTNGDFLEHKVSAGSLVEPAGSPSALAAGALCWEPGSFVVPGYSSRGPTIDGRTKPDLLGYDGVSSATYGLSSDCETSEFLGTSPAAAHVSGAAALLLQANPSFGPAQLQATLESLAADLPPAGKDNVSGSGKLRLGAAPPPPPPANPPSATPQSVTTDEDTAELVTLAGADPDSDPLTFRISSLPAHGTLYRGDSTASADQISAVPTSLTGNEVTYTPAAHYNGADGFAFRAADATAESPPATVSITVAPVNDAPVCLDRALSTDEDTPASLAPSCSDVDTATLTYAIVTQGAKGSAAVADGQLRYTPDANANGTDSFGYRASDGSADSEAAAVAVTINAVNDAPVCADRALSTNEDTPASLAPACGDVDSAMLTYAIVTQGAKGSAAVADGQLRYTPDANANGADSFRYRASDGSGTSSPATVTVAIDPVNDAPSATAQAVTTNEDTAKLVLLAGTDPDGDPLTFKITSLPAHATLFRGSSTSPADRITAVPAALSGNQVTFEPVADYAGADSFHFEATDAALESAAAEVSVTIAAVNHAPVCADRALSTDEDTTASVAPSCSDVDSAMLTYAIVTQGTKGSAAVADGQLYYTPDANANGTDSFGYRASDGSATSSPATVTVAINPVNDAPSATAQAVTTNEDTAKLVLLAGSDPDGDPLTFTITSLPAHGTLYQGSSTSPAGRIALVPAALSGNQVTFEPAADYAGADSFHFKATDATLESAARAVSITTQPVNDAPLAVDDTATSAEDTVASMNASALIANDLDIDGDTLTLTEVSTPAHGEVTLKDGVVSFTPEPNYHGLAGFQYAVSDGQGGSDTGAVTVTVTQAPGGVLPPPLVISVPPPPQHGDPAAPPPQHGDPVQTDVPQVRTLVVLAFTRSPGAPQAGRRFTLIVRIATRVTSARGATRSVSCSARIVRRTLRPAAKSVGGGVGRCSWTIPRNATGKRLVSSIAIREGTQSIRRSFSAKVRRAP